MREDGGAHLWLLNLWRGHRPAELRAVDAHLVTVLDQLHALRCRRGHRQLTVVAAAARVPPTAAVEATAAVQSRALKKITEILSSKEIFLETSKKVSEI